MELERKIDELGRVVQEFKSAHQKELDEVKKSGAASAETSSKVEKLNEKISSLEGEIKAVQTAMNRAGQAEENQAKASEYTKHLNSFLRKGISIPSEAIKAAQAHEFKDMSVMIDEDGGFLVTPEMSAEVVKKVFESSPMRQLASAQTISTDALEILEDLDELESGWVGETQARASTDTPVLKMVRIPVHELYAMPQATQKLLDDASINVESWLAGKVSEKFARDEATAFVSGDGALKPKGFLSYAAGNGFNMIEYTESVVNGDFDDEDLINLMYSLKEPYKANATWLMQRNTIKKIRKFKGTDGHYLWSPGLDGKSNSQVLGYPIMEANDMAFFDSVLANNYGTKPVAFGDFRQGYQIVDRIGIRVLRDPFTSKPFVKFYTTKRVGGGVKNFEAIKVLVLNSP